MIAFNIAGAGVKTIKPSQPKPNQAAALPEITAPLSIDGTTQPGFAGTPIVELDGSLAGAGVNGLAFAPSATANGAPNLVKGLIINRFAFNGVYGGANIVGNWIGLDSTGNLDAGNGLDGVQSARNVIGNVISGNNRHGIASGAEVRDNYVGTNAAGTADVGNAGAGINLGTWIHDNVVSGNDGGGVVAGGTSQVYGNRIGTNAAGTAAIGNTGNGVTLTSGDPRVGDADNGNVIAYNTGHGIQMTFGIPIIWDTFVPGPTFSGNSIHSNGGLGIDLPKVTGGVDPNDVDDNDRYENQNFPVLAYAASGNGVTVVAGTLDSNEAGWWGGGHYRIEFFASASPDSSGHGEGAVYLGGGSISTDGDGDASFFFQLAAPVPAGSWITATATGPRVTSEFSFAIPVVAAAAATLTPNAPMKVARDGATLAVFLGGAAAPTWTNDVSIAGCLTLGSTGDGNDRLTIDYAGGDPLAAGGIRFDGGAGDSDSLAIIGSAGQDIVPFYVPGYGTDGEPGIFTGDELEVRTFDGNGGDDLVNVNTYHPVQFNGPQELQSLRVPLGASVSVAPGGRNTLFVRDFIIDGTLDLADNDLVIDYTGDSPIGAWQADAAWYDGITGRLQSAYNYGAWDGSGITTSQPDAKLGLTTLAVVEAASALGISGNETAIWDGRAVDATTLIIKYTYSGDVDVNGVVDGADYGVIDNWVQFPGTNGYMNGDFNYDGVIDGADYGIIDNAVQLQGLPQ